MKYKVGQEFIAKHPKHPKGGWDGAIYHVTIVGIDGLDYILDIKGVSHKFHTNHQDRGEYWLDRYCTPLTRLHKALR